MAVELASTVAEFEVLVAGLVTPLPVAMRVLVAAGRVLAAEIDATGANEKSAAAPTSALVRLVADLERRSGNGDGEEPDDWSSPGSAGAGVPPVRDAPKL